MKRLLSLALYLCLAGYPLFCQNTGYPDIMNNGSFFLNGGIGFGKALSSEMKVPPLLVSGDWAIPVAALPFTIGLATAYSAESLSVNNNSRSSKNLGLGLRIALHSGWNIQRLDSYLLLNLGDIFAWESDSAKNQNNELRNIFWFAIGGGARYFFLPNFGAYAELVLGKLHFVSFGVSCKI